MGMPLTYEAIDPTDCVVECPSTVEMQPTAQGHPTLVMVGLNFRTAAISTREKLAFCRQNMPAVLRDIAACPDVEEALLLSTCNRTELYAVVRHCDDWQRLLRDLILRHSQGASRDEVDACLYWHADAHAARHLFRVAAGLESMVLGEAEIVHQLKLANKLAREEGTAGTILQRLGDAALAASKRARTQVRYEECGLSIASLAVSACKRAFKDLRDLSVLVLGAGETAELTLHYLVSKGVRKVVVANRTLERAQQLARLTGGEALPLAEFPSRLQEADIIVSCTSSPHPILTRAMFAPIMAQHADRRLLIVDLAVPRDVEPAVAELPRVQLLNIDHFSGTEAAIDQQRREKIATAERIIDSEAEKFGEWLSSRKVVSTIMALQQQFDLLREDTAVRLTAALQLTDEDQKQVLDRYLNALVSDLLRQPIHALKAFACSEDADTRVEVVRSLFDLK